MITPKKKICKGCGDEDFIWARGMCKKCASKNPKPKKTNIRETPKKEKVKPTGELALFQAIWNTRPHFCTLCNEPLGEFSVWYFSHILPKSTFKRFRLYEKNIVLKCAAHHHDYETKAYSDLIKDSRWLPIFNLKEELREEYTTITQSTS